MEHIAFTIFSESLLSCRTGFDSNGRMGTKIATKHDRHRQNSL